MSKITLATAVALAVLAPATAHASVASTERVSLTSTGEQLDGESTRPAISADGRWVAFESLAAAVPGDDNSRSDVYLRDRRTGETRRINEDNGGNSNAPSMSNDGRYIAFSSAWQAPGARNLVRHVVLYDRTTGGLTRVDKTPDGGEPEFGSGNARISPDGTHVVFESFSNDLVEGDTGGKDVFDYDIATQRIRRVSVTPDGGAPDGPSWGPDVSAGGRFVSYSSDATDLIDGDNDATADVFV